MLLLGRRAASALARAGSGLAPWRQSVLIPAVQQQQRWRADDAGDAKPTVSIDRSGLFAPSGWSSIQFKISGAESHIKAAQFFLKNILYILCIF